MKKRKLPIYQLVINEKAEESGVDYVAMVDDPAIEERGMWLMFDKQKSFEFKGDAEKRIVSGFLMVADMPIYRKDDAKGEYYVVFTKETIDKIRKKFSKQNYFNNVNVMHNKDLKVEGVYMLDNFAVGGELNIPTPKGFDKAPDGSWYASYYVENEKFWQEYLKTGILQGFSVEGMFSYDYEEKANPSEMTAMLSELKTFIDNLK